MAGSSIPSVTDYLVATAKTTSAGIMVGGQNVLVADGLDKGSSKAMFVVGLEQPPDNAQAQTAGTHTWGPLGAKPVDEDYTVPCYIQCWSGNVAQKAMRDAAFSIFDPFFLAIWSDLTLGGALTGGLNADVVDLSSIPTSVTADAVNGRAHLITFSVHCRSRYIPS